jgi:hypothetical protein
LVLNERVEKLFEGMEVAGNAVSSVLEHERDALASLLLQVMSVCQSALQAQQDACAQANVMASVMSSAVKASERIQVRDVFSLTNSCGAVCVEA